MTLEGPWTARLRYFARDVLGPTLRPGQVVAVDNLSVTATGGPGAIEECACTLSTCHLLARPCPVEPAIAKIKAHLRKVARAHPGRPGSGRSPRRCADHAEDAQGCSSDMQATPCWPNHHATALVHIP